MGSEMCIRDSIRGTDFTTILARFNAESLLVTVVGSGVDPDQVLHQIDEFILAQRTVKVPAE